MLSPVESWVFLALLSVSVVGLFLSLFVGDR
jgi:hypothetical protein